MARAGVDPSVLLDAVPTPNRALRVEPRGSGLLIWVPIRKRWWMGPPMGWILPFRPEKGVELDSLGRQVFTACDGSRTTEQIVEEFAGRHQLRFHEARLCVLTFLKSLVERNLVALVASKDHPS